MLENSLVWGESHTSGLVSELYPLWAKQSLCELTGLSCLAGSLQRSPLWGSSRGWLGGTAPCGEGRGVKDGHQCCFHVDAWGQHVHAGGLGNSPWGLYITYLTVSSRVPCLIRFPFFCAFLLPSLSLPRLLLASL